MKTISGRTFKNEEVVLDFRRFEDCKFMECNVIINGHGAFQLIRCTFVGGKFVFGEAAERTVLAMTLLYHAGAQQMIERTFENIRRGTHHRPGP
jgi:hypothetical protein